MSTQLNTDTQPATTVNFLFSNEKIADIKNTADSCLDKAEAVGAKYAKASSNEFFPWMIDTILSLLSRLGLSIKAEEKVKPFTASAIATSNKLVDVSSRTSNIIARPIIHRGIDIGLQTSNTIGGIFSTIVGAFRNK